MSAAALACADTSYGGIGDILKPVSWSLFYLLTWMLSSAVIIELRYVTLEMGGKTFQIKYYHYPSPCIL